MLRKAHRNYDEGSDTERESAEIFYHMPRLTRSGARNRLNRQHEHNFIKQMMGCLETDLRQCEPEVEALPTECEFDASEMLRSSISSWRYQRNLLSSKSRASRTNHANGSESKPRLKAMAKCRRDTNSLLLNEFLNGLQAKIRGAASEVEGIPKLKTDMKQDSIFDRPAQMIHLQEIVAGTPLDELRDARTKVLQKLSKNCADWIVNHCSPSVNRDELQEALKQELKLKNDTYDALNARNKSTEGIQYGLTLADSLFELASADDLGPV